MKHLLTLLAVLFSLTAYSQSNIYNPDSDDDGLITAEDLLIFLSLYDTPFEPNPCNCACYSNLFIEDFAHQNESIQDTISAQDVAANLFYAQPDSIRMDFVIAPYGIGTLPFHDGIDTLYYDTLAFSQTYPFNYVAFDQSPSSSYYGGAGYGNDVAFMQYREPYAGTSNYAPYAWNITSGNVQGGLDIADIGSPLIVEAQDLCPNMLNDEYWYISETTEFFQVDEGVYANVIENAGSNIPTQNSSEMGSSWIFHYPLSWIVFTEIYNSTEE
jgi:hypothetical protein